MGLTRTLCSRWEVRDNRPRQVTKLGAVIMMAYPPLKSGEPGGQMTAVVNEAVRWAMEDQSHIIASNSWPCGPEGVSVAEVERDMCIAQGVPAERIHIPREPRSRYIRNTPTEARFALNTLETLKVGSFLIVANHLHMKRVYATFIKQYSLMNRPYLGAPYWVSVGQDAYGPGYSQERFSHPLLFLPYELAGYAYSKYKGYI